MGHDFYHMRMIKTPQVIGFCLQGILVFFQSNLKRHTAWRGAIAMLAHYPRLKNA